MELLLKEHHQLVEEHLQKIDSVISELEVSSGRNAQSILARTEDYNVDWVLEQTHTAKFSNIYIAIKVLLQGRQLCTLTKQQEFSCAATLLELKLDIAPVTEIEQLLHEVKQFGQQLDTKDSLYRVLLLQGDIHAATGNASLAFDMYGKAVSMCLSQEDPMYLDPFIRQQSCLHVQGKNKQALNNLLPLMECVEHLPSHLEALLKKTLGDVYRSNANWHKAESLLIEAIDIAKRCGDSIHEGEWKGDLGQVYRSSGLHHRALALQLEAYEAALNRGDKARLAIACGYLGFTKYALTQPDHCGALFYLGVRLVISETLGDKYGIGWCLNNIGKVYLSLKEMESAIHFFERRLQLAKETGNLLGEGTALGNLGNAYRDLCKYAEAIKYHQLYKENASLRLDIGGEAIMLRELVMDCIFSAQYNEALQYAVQGVVRNNVIRARFSQQDDQFKIANHEKNQARLYGLLQFLLTKLEMYESALLISEMGRARALSDLMVQRCTSDSAFLVDMDKVITSDQNMDTAAVHRCFTHVAKLASSLQSIIIIYSVLEEPQSIARSRSCVYIWVVRPGESKVHFQASVLGVDAVKLAIDEDYISTLRRDMEITSRDIKARKSHSKVIPTTNKLEMLHNALIAPVEEYLAVKHGSKILVIPHGFLFNIPFSALKCQGKYLIERFSISQAPSLAVLYQLASFKNDNTYVKTKLIVGNPVMPREDIPQLPGAEKEAKHLHTVLGGELLLGKEATKDAVLEQLPKHALIHLATHAMISDSIEDYLETGEQHLEGDYSVKGAIILSQSNETCSGILTTNELQALNLSSCELLTLSCCKTACGRVTGDGVLGLSRAGLIAGARCLVLTHWRVHDSLTPKLMEAFYSHYSYSYDASKALQAGMLKLLGDGESVAHWAAFSVIGLSPGMIDQ